MKTIKIALASSEELQEDRKEFEIFINRKNKLLIKDDVFLELVMWEDFIDAMSQTRLQEEYNKVMQSCDIFVMLFFTKVGIYTREEFELAFGKFKEDGHPLVYTYFKTANINTGSLNRQDADSLFDFRDILFNLGHFTSKYPDIGELKYQFTSQLDKLFAEGYFESRNAEHCGRHSQRSRWERESGLKTIDIYYLPKPAAKLVGRTDELKTLNDTFNDKNIHIIGIIAAGGIGKSGLVDAWLQGIKADYQGLMFGWSFYSQGTHDTQTSSTQFFEAALPFLGYDGELLTDDTAKGRKLAELMRNQPSILVLDGVEPLQNSVMVDGRWFKDSGLAALLLDVRQHGLNERSLIIVTSRQKLVELDKGISYQNLDLQHLLVDDGVALLQSLGVKGLKSELETAMKAYGGHALALVLLGNLLVRYYKGDVNQHERLPVLEYAEGKHAERVMQFYDQYWTETRIPTFWENLGLSKEQLKPEQIFLRLLGLFDRPMDDKALDALLKKAKFTRPLAKLSTRQRQVMLVQLQDIGLLLEKDNGYDTHPLVRNYFGEILKNQNSSAWQQAHLVLFKYFQTVPEKQQPDTLQDLEPLYRAVKHGCLAGEYYKADFDVYWERIKRGDEHYSLKKLGAYAQDLTAIATFFPKGWEQPVSSGLSEANQAWLLSEASFYLMSLGRLAEAVKPRREHLKISEKLEDWEDATTAAQNLVDLLLPIGQLTKAKQVAQQAIEFAERTDDQFQQMVNNSGLATVLHRQVELVAALEQFELTEKIQCEWQPEYPKLYSLPGSQYCVLLLNLATDTAAREAILKRGQYSLKIFMEQNDLLSIALDCLTIARALFALNRFKEAIKEFEQAVARIREAGKINFMP